MNAKDKKFIARGCSWGTAKGRQRGICLGKKITYRHWAPIDNSPRNENPPSQNEEIEQNVEVEVEKNICQEEEVKTEMICISLVDQC